MTGLMDRIEKWLLGSEHPVVDTHVAEEAHAEFREQVHTNRNMQMMAQGSVDRATKAQNHTTDVARTAIARLEQARRAAAREPPDEHAG